MCHRKRFSHSEFQLRMERVTINCSTVAACHPTWSTQCIELLLAGWTHKFCCHSDQFSQGLSLHLTHDMPALDLHSDFARSQFISYLLIQPARNHQAHDLALACRQRFVALSQFAEFTFLLPGNSVAIQRLLDRIQQVLVPKGFGKELHPR